MKVIVVDDEPIIADTLVDILNGEGFEALAVSDGAGAVRWAEMMRPDVVVTDVVMPGMNGIEAAKLIIKLLPDCRIILFSGQAVSTHLLSQAEAEGHSFEVLAKPINPDVLLSTLHSGPAPRKSGMGPNA